MKILHTADWHLGKSFNNVSLLSDQKYILEQLLAIIIQEKPDLVLLAGDIYDRAAPPADAVVLFDDIVSKIVIDCQIPLLAIAGNHDSSERIDYLSSFSAKQGFHIVGKLKLPLEPIVFEDNFGKVYFYAIPYTEPETLHRILEHYQTTEQGITLDKESIAKQREMLKNHSDIMKYLVNEIVSKHHTTDRIVFIGHLFVTGAKECKDSERQLSIVGGAAEVSASIFSPLTYTALGHLHEEQYFIDKKVAYAGSPLKYSFAEADHDKGVLMLTLDHEKVATIQTIPLKPQRDMLKVRGRIENEVFSITDENLQPAETDFLEVMLDNKVPIINAMKIIQQKYPNAQKLSYEYLKNQHQDGKLTVEKLGNISETELFSLFYQKVTQQTMDSNHEEVIATAVRNLMCV